MTQRSLVYVSLLSVALTTFVLNQANWLAPRTQRTCALSTHHHDEALNRWRHAQPHHWRECMLRR